MEKFCLPDKFKFELSQRLKDTFPTENRIYDVEKTSERTYKISWQNGSSYYDISMVEKFINNGDWVMV